MSKGHLKKQKKQGTEVGSSKQPTTASPPPHSPPPAPVAAGKPIGGAGEGTTIPHKKVGGGKK